MLNSVSYKTPPHLIRYVPQNEINFKGSIKNTGFDALKKEFDKKIFTFLKEDGSEFSGTIKEYFKNCIIGMNPVRKEYMYHCTPNKETVRSILAEGLDWTKTNRMKAGPGTYFSPSRMGGAEQGAGNNAIEAVYIGNKREYPVFSKNFYEAVDFNKEIQNTASEYGEDGRELVNKYCHDVLCDEMGIDYLYASTGRGTGAYTVLKNDCMQLSASPY